MGSEDNHNDDDDDGQIMGDYYNYYATCADIIGRRDTWYGCTSGVIHLGCDSVLEVRYSG
jgi:hypothetical protein